MKLILILIFSSISILLVFCNKTKTYPLLECIISSYINSFPIKNDQVIYLNLLTKWTDSTSIIVIHKLDIERLEYDINLFYTKFKSNDIYLYLITEYSNTNIHKNEILIDSINYLIPSNLVWTRVNMEDVKINKEPLLYPIDYPEEQIVFDPIDKCIIEILGSETGKTTTTMSECQGCNYK